MREAERPIEERLSVLDRPRTPDDEPPELFFRVGGMTEGVDESSVRLMLALDGFRLYLARGTNDDDIYQFIVGAHGGGASGGFRSTLVTHGAAVAWNSGADGCVIHGIVPDR